MGKPQPELDPYRDELEHLRQALGTRIRELRKLKGWSQEQFADHAKIHRTFAGSLERGEKNVSFHGLALIARCFGMTLSDLLAGLEAGGSAKSVRRKKQAMDRDRILEEAAALEKTARRLYDIAGGKEHP